MQQPDRFAPIKNSPTQWERLALYFVMIVGSFLRFQNLGSVESNIDQVYPVWQALNTLNNGVVPLVGQGTSVLFPNPPMTGYLFLPFLAIVPLQATAFVVAITLNTCALFFVYRGLRWVTGTRPALVATMLFAVNPWVIEESRRTWVQSLMPFFVSLIFWALVPIFTQQTKYPNRRLLLALVALTITANTYLLAYAFTVPVGLLLLIFWRRIPKKSLIAGGAFFIFIMALYFYGLYRDWASVEAQINNFQSGQRQFTNESITHAVRLVTGWDFALLRGKEAPIQDWELRNQIADIFHYFWASLLLIGVGHAIYRAIFDSARRDVALVLLVWFVVPIVAMSYVSESVHLHYQIIGLPASYGLLAWVLIPVLKNKWGVTVLSLVLVSTGLIHGLNTLRYAQASAHNRIYDYPVLVLSDITSLGEMVNEHQHDEVIYTDLDGWTVIASAGRTLDVIRQEAPTTQIIAEGGSLYIYLESPDTSYDFLYAEKIDATLPLENDHQVSIWQAEQNFAIPHATDIPSDIGLSFVGWEIRGDMQPGATVEVITFWHIDELLPQRFGWILGPYVHIYDASENRVGIADGTVIEPITWGVNDLVIQRITVNLPADSQAPYQINTGYFDSVHLFNGIFRIPQPDGTTLFTADIPLTLDQ